MPVCITIGSYKGGIAYDWRDKVKAIIFTTKTLHSPDDAEKLAAEMNASDPDWRYIARHDPEGKGWSFVEIFDEDGQKIGVM